MVHLVFSLHTRPACGEQSTVGEVTLTDSSVVPKSLLAPTKLAALFQNLYLPPPRDSLSLGDNGTHCPTFKGL